MLPLQQIKFYIKGRQRVLSGVGGLQEVSARDSPRGEFPTGAKPPTLLQHFGTWLLRNTLY